jgi:hypothetical protein
MTDKQTPIYLTKYPLTKGIQKYYNWKIYGRDLLELKGFYGVIRRSEYAYTLEEAYEQIKIAIEKERKLIAKKISKLDDLEKLVLDNALPIEEIETH